MKATDILREEHEVILKVLECLNAAVKSAEQTNELDTDTAGKAIEFFHGFADTCHHRKEEEGLFPMLGIRAPADSSSGKHPLLAEHEQGRESIRAMAESLAAYEKGDVKAIQRYANAARKYIENLTQHIYKENHALFPMADERLSTTEQADLHAAFDRLEEHEMGAGTHEKFTRIADELCSKWNVKPIVHNHVCGCGH